MVIDCAKSPKYLLKLAQLAAKALSTRQNIIWFYNIFLIVLTLIV